MIPKKCLIIPKKGLVIPTVVLALLACTEAELEVESDRNERCEQRGHEVLACHDELCDEDSELEGSRVCDRCLRWNMVPNPLSCDCEESFKAIEMYLDCLETGNDEYDCEIDRSLAVEWNEVCS